MSEYDLNDKLVAVLQEVFGLKADQIVPELTKDEVGNWDSLKQMDLIVSLEREFSIVLEISDIIKMDSVSNIMTILKNKRGDCGPE